MEEHSTDWWKALARPQDFLPFLLAARRSSSEIADLFGCPIEQAEAIVSALGFTQERDGRCARTHDPAAELLWQSILLIEDLGHTPSEERLREMLPPP
jgi:hypothetical protein